MKKIKLLLFVDRLGHGGIQTLLLNILDKIDKEKFEISFLNFDFGVKYELEDKVVKAGAKLYKVPHPQKHPFKCMKETKQFFKTHHFDIVHCHSSSKAAVILKYAKKYKVPVRIAHSHADSFQSKNFLLKLVGNMLMIPLNRNATHYCACSQSAGKWMFGHWYSKKIPITIIKNAIDLNKYKYNEKTDLELRALYKIDKSTKVFGHVGRFMRVKNQTFLINAFYEYLKINNNAKLILIGIGVLKEEAENLVKELHIEDKVIFTGYQSDTAKFYSLFDVFVLPSLVEGLPFVGVEAQASGLKCLFSDHVSKEIALIEENCKFIPLVTDEWVKTFDKVEIIKNRELTYLKLKEEGFDLSDEIKKLEEYYQNNLKEVSL